MLTADTFVGTFSAQQYRALVDTGAQRSVISRSVIADQGLIRTGHMEFSGLHGPQTHSRYLASIGLWGLRISSGTSYTDDDPVELSLFQLEDPFEVVDMENNINFDLILGFDILKCFDFSFDHRAGLLEIILSP